MRDEPKCFTNAIARRVGEKNERAMQNFIGTSPWDDHAVLMEHQLIAQETLGHPVGHPDGCIIMDGSGFPRKGTEPAGDEPLCHAELARLVSSYDIGYDCLTF